MRRVVIKIGTAALTRSGARIHHSVLQMLAQDISAFLREDFEIVLVSSGAVAQGQAMLNRPDLSKRVYAAVGQPHMLALYEEAFAAQGIKTAQIVLGQKDLLNKETYGPLQATLKELMHAGILPIVNENDAITNETAATFYENDSLAVALALALHADAVLLLSSVDGLFTEDPRHSPHAALIPRVTDVTKELMRLCEKTKSAQGSGGMIAKVKAARLAASFGIATIIANGAKAGVVSQALAGKAVGTTFVPIAHARTLRSRDRWILAAKIATGSLIVDHGAATALKKGKSLLAVGLRRIAGAFKQGEIIEVLTEDGEPLAVGIVNASDQQIRQRLAAGAVYNQEIIHADNLIVIH